MGYGMDVTSRMLAEAYDETVAEALAQGMDSTVAHREGITAAAMFLAAMSGVEDAQARVHVEKLIVMPVNA